jgi:hypothetical protein
LELGFLRENTMTIVTALTQGGTKTAILMRLYRTIKLLLLLLPLSLAAQDAHWEGGVTVGARGYQGELSRGLLPEFDEIGASYGLLLRRHFSPSWSLRLNANYSSIEGTDLAVYERRNYAFEATYLHGALLLEWDPFGKKRYPQPYLFKRRISPYIYTGIGWMQYEANASFTTGENGHEQRVQADQAQTFPMQSLALPFGVGVKADLSRTTVIGFELTTMTAFSDYLDGISQAGNPDANDWLPGASVTLSFRFLPKDSDRDGIADEEDACPQIKGAWSAMGCPDQDGDGVEDLEDLCPELAGSMRLNGCPDGDGDGVADREDRCPLKAGPKYTGGCPDRDEDGLADLDDACPSLPGPNWREGCPALDTDGDGELSDEPVLCIQQPVLLDEALLSELEHYFGSLVQLQPVEWLQLSVSPAKEEPKPEQGGANFNF